MIKNLIHIFKTYFQSFQAVRISDTKVITVWVLIILSIFIGISAADYVYFIF